MSRNDSQWTLLSLKEYLEKLLEEHFAKIDQQFLAMDRAVSKAEISTERRFESVNEFRAQLGDQARTFIPRKEVEVILNSLETKILEVSKCVEKMQNIKQGGNIVWAYVVSTISFIIAVISTIINLI